MYVAVNLGKFNRPAGAVDSWVYVYDAQTLKLLARHKVPELVHGAGGIAWRGGRFFVVGGLPPGTEENYEYDADFRFRKRHVLKSGYTLMGIQTVAWDGDSWWFGCYGRPQVLLRADARFRLTAKWEFDASLGLAPLPDGRFLIGRNAVKEGSHHGHALPTVKDEKRGLKHRKSGEPGWAAGEKR